MREAVLVQDEPPGVRDVGGGSAGHDPEIEERACDGDLFNLARDQELTRIEEASQEELFATANAAHAVKDLTSYRLQGVINIEQYVERLAEHFGIDGPHDFIIGLRNIYQPRPYGEGWLAGSIRFDPQA